MKFFFLFLTFFSVYALPALIQTERSCPACQLETCRWEIQVQHAAAGNQLDFSWNKSVVTRHMEKPKAVPLHCNVDRDFNEAAGGYIKVWFLGEKNACDTNTEKDPTRCGVHFIFDPFSAHPIFPIGFTIKAPQGKTLAKVEHFSTLNLQCGVFHQTDLVNHSQWDVKIGWDAALPGDGTYASTVKRQF